ncbi:hypothetical protein CBOM_01062 [Ceraceosorus bombacis]|uniref:Uncharacterized protein n=1 Tax=Ceraceosorus bombacis TaxID=401625 RepID=A0A0P1BAU7_9BASI|nr:hypothetical protein CBOM_01062 [Ceraceosorus bombacis]
MSTLLAGLAAKRAHLFDFIVVVSIIHWTIVYSGFHLESTVSHSAAFALRQSASVVFKGLAKAAQLLFDIVLLVLFVFLASIVVIPFKSSPSRSTAGERWIWISSLLTQMLNSLDRFITEKLASYSHLGLDLRTTLQFESIRAPNPTWLNHIAKKAEVNSPSRVAKTTKAKKRRPRRKNVKPRPDIEPKATALPPPPYAPRAGQTETEPMADDTKKLEPASAPPTHADSKSRRTTEWVRKGISVPPRPLRTGSSDSEPMVDDCKKAKAPKASRAPRVRASGPSYRYRKTAIVKSKRALANRRSTGSSQPGISWSEHPIDPLQKGRETLQGISEGLQGTLGEQQGPRDAPMTLEEHGRASTDINRWREGRTDKEFFQRQEREMLQREGKAARDAFVKQNLPLVWQTASVGDVGLTGKAVGQPHPRLRAPSNPSNFSSNAISYPAPSKISRSSRPIGRSMPSRVLLHPRLRAPSTPPTPFPVHLVL